MEDLSALFGEHQRLVAEFARLLAEAKDEMMKAIDTDPAIQAALNPDNEYVKYDRPVMWEDLEEKRVRANTFLRNFRFELE